MEDQKMNEFLSGKIERVASATLIVPAVARDRDRGRGDRDADNVVFCDRLSNNGGGYTKFVSDLVGQFPQKPFHVMNANRSSGVIDTDLEHPAACICKCTEGLEVFVLPGLLEFNVLALDHGGCG